MLLKPFAHMLAETWKRSYSGISNENVQLIIHNKNKESPIPMSLWKRYKIACCVCFYLDNVDIVPNPLFKTKGWGH